MLSDIIRQFRKTFQSNAPEILTALAASGVVTTAYLTGKASFKAAGKLESEAPDMPLVDKTKKVWKCYIPPAISGCLTIGCIVASSKGYSRRTTAAVTAYSLTERAFSEYKEKIADQIGSGREKKVRDDIAQDKVKNSSPKQEIVVVGPGYVMCCELFTQRYFRSNMETLRKAENEINQRINRDRYVSLDEFYDLLELQHTSHSGNIGWDSDKLMELKFTTVLSDNGEPCLAFDYSYTKPLK